MAGLRERRHQQTRQSLVDTALALFSHHGYHAITMEEIAHEAGVSRSTAYRRFATKEELVLEIPRRWLEVFDEAIDGLPATTGLPEAMSTACLAVASHIDENQQTVRAAYAVLDEVPGLRASGVATTAWLERTLALVSRFSDVDEETAHVLAGAHLGAIDAMMGRWAATGGTTSVREATDRVLMLLRPSLAASIPS